MGEFKPVDLTNEEQLDASVEKPVSEADAMLLEKVLENSGIDAQGLEDPNRAVEIEKILNEQVEALASTRPKSSLNELLRKGRKLGLPLITAAAILIGASCVKEKDELSLENQQTSSRIIDNEKNNTIEIQEVGENAELQQAFFEVLSKAQGNDVLQTIKSGRFFNFKKIDEVAIDNATEGLKIGDWVSVTSNGNSANKYKVLVMGSNGKMSEGGLAINFVNSVDEEPIYSKGDLYEITISNPAGGRLKGYVVYPSY